MTTTRTLQQPDVLIEEAVKAADHGIRSTQQVANEVLDSLAGTVQKAGQKATPAVNQASEQAGAMAQRALDAMRNSSQQIRDKALQASDSTVGYIKDEPVKAILIAAVAGAALMALVGLLSRSRNSD